VNEVLIIVVGAIVQGGVGFLFWVAGQRNVEKFDRISRELQELKDNRVKGIEEDLEERGKTIDIRFDGAAKARKEIYEELRKIRETFVKTDQCIEVHKRMETAYRELKETIAQFLSATADMARCEERIALVMETMKDFEQRLIDVKEDVDQEIGRRKHG
jgi:outer membrane murein-binding lipoprotein Lpp